MRGMNSQEGFIPPTGSHGGVASMTGEAALVLPACQEGPLLVQVAANELDATRRRSLPPPITRAQNRDEDRGVSDPIPGAAWSPHALFEGSLTPLVSISAPRAMSRYRLRNGEAVSAFSRMAVAAGTSASRGKQRIYCKVSSASSVHPM
jgi:hypothetical protein